MAEDVADSITATGVVGINKDQVARIVKGTSSINTENTDKQFFEGIHYYIEDLAHYLLIEPDELKANFEKENKFYSSLRNVLNEFEPRLSSQVPEGRMVGTDLIALYHLFINGGLDRLYQRHIGSREERGKTLAESEIEIKTKLAHGYLEVLRYKNKEKITSEKENWPITVGIEIEYPKNVFYQALRKYSQAFLDLDLFAYEGADVDSLPEELAQDRPDLFDTIRSCSFLFGNKIPEYYQLARMRDIIDVINRSMIGLESLGILTPVDNVPEGQGDRELRLKPSINHKTLLREALILYNSGLMGRGSWNVHTTIASIELNRNHTEIMDVLLMSAAAGFLPESLLDDEMDKAESTELSEDGNIQFDEFTIVEKVPKESSDGFYYPFHKARKPHSIDSYASRSNYHSVERRGVFNYEMVDFINLVREMFFTEYASLAIHAIQNPSRKNKALAKAWKKLTGEYWKLAKKNGMQKLSTEDYYSESIFEDGRISAAATRYNQLLTDCLVESFFNPKFKAETRKIIRNFRRSVKKYYSKD